MTTDPSLPVARTITCPVCRELPNRILGPEQAICDTSGCAVMLFSFLIDPADQRSESIQHDLRGGSTVGPLAEHNISPQVLAARLNDPGWCEHAAKVRDRLHRWGIICMSGCPVCDDQAPLSEGQTAAVRKILEKTMALVPRQPTEPIDVYPLVEAMMPIGLMYGKPGLNLAKTLIPGLARGHFSR